MKFNVEDLIEQGLVKKKTYTEGKYKGLSVLKYTRKVFYDNLWHLDERLLECRGIVVDEEDNVIVKPFTKCFNYLESGCCADVEDNRPVVAVEKINGFMGAVTLTKKYGYKVVSLVVEKRHNNSNNHDVPEHTLKRQEQRLRGSLKLS